MTESFETDSPWIELIPAYGRDYTNQKSVLADWNANKDFRTASSRQLINKDGCKKYFPNASILIRYSNLEKVMNVK